MSETDDKPWWQSRTIVAIGVSLTAKLALLAGVEIDVQDITEIVLLVLAMVADIGGIWGRNRARRPIRWRVKVDQDLARAVPFRADPADERVHGDSLEPVPSDPGRSAPDSPFEH